MIFYENNFLEYLADWINLHNKNETADAVFKNHIVILLNTLFWNKKSQNVTEKLKVFLDLKKRLFTWKHMFYQSRCTVKTDQFAQHPDFQDLKLI